MGDSDDYYGILGVARNASDEDIKRAYKKAALRWHPDKNPDDKERAEAMFKSVAEAYNVLTDPQKRSLYDRGGKAALQEGSGMSRGSAGFRHGNDAFTIFEQFFGGRDPFAEFDEIFAQMGAGQNQRRSRGMAGDDVFSRGFGGGSGFSSSVRMVGGLGGGMSTSVMTTTRIVNGQRVQVTEKTVRKADGTVETTKMVNGQLVEKDEAEVAGKLRDRSQTAPPQSRAPCISADTPEHGGSAPAPRNSSGSAPPGASSKASLQPTAQEEASTEDAAEGAPEQRASGLMRLFSCARCFRPKYSAARPDAT